jgi:hypothetical protein
MVTLGNALLLVLGAEQSWVTFPLTACWVVTLCRPSVVLLKVLADA